jgi:hypothetical protein
LSYINIIHQSSFYSGIDDINKIIPSFCILNSDYKTRDFLYKAAYEPFAETAVSVTIQNKLTNDDRKENVLYYEIKAFGKPTSTSKGDADEWFIHAHEAVGKTFLNMTSKEAKEFWGKK